MLWWISRLVSGWSGNSGGSGLNDSDGVLLRLKNLNVIGESLLGTHLALRVRRLHDSDSDTNDTSLHLNVAVGLVNEHVSGSTRRDHVSVLELHDLSSLGSQLTRNNNLDTLSAVLHDESENTVSGSSDGETVEELVSEGLGLCGRGETSVVDSLGVELDRLVRETESSLNQSGEFPDSSSLLTEHTSGSGGSDDDLGSNGGNSNLDTGVTILSEDASEKLVELGIEDSILHVLLLLGELKLNISHD